MSLVVSSFLRVRDLREIPKRGEAYLYLSIINTVYQVANTLNKRRPLRNDVFIHHATIHPRNQLLDVWSLIH
jgi:hypothetical protein